jgi:hypothetical protein
VCVLLFKTHFSPFNQFWLIFRPLFYEHHQSTVENIHNLHYKTYLKKHKVHINKIKYHNTFYSLRIQNQNNYNIIKNVKVIKFVKIYCIMCVK